MPLKLDFNPISELNIYIYWNCIQKIHSNQFPACSKLILIIEEEKKCPNRWNETVTSICFHRFIDVATEICTSPYALLCGFWQVCSSMCYFWQRIVIVLKWRFAHWKIKKTKWLRVWAHGSRKEIDGCTKETSKHTWAFHSS